MAVSETIQEILQGIDDSQYGRDMRDYIHKGIQKCYEEGSAGETDLVARESIDELDTAVGEWYHLPVTISENYGGSLINNYVVINPKTKTMLVRVYMENSTDNTIVVSDDALTGLPIPAVPNRLVYNYSFYFPLIAQNSASGSGLPFKTDYIGVARLSLLFNGNTFMNQGCVNLLTQIPAHTRLNGSIVVPYTSLSDEHPFSEATLITG